MKRLRILHTIRTPVGGSFRHVCDLSRGQAAAGHEVGLICDAGIGGPGADDALTRLGESLALGVHRFAMSRQLGLRDLAATARIGALVRKLKPHVLHGHGAKGGAYMRLLGGGKTAKVFYTPHGGSLHYNRKSPIGLVYLTLESLLQRRTDGLLFESNYARKVYGEKVGAPRCPVAVVHNGLGEDEFQPVSPDAYAADFVYVGELRMLKGIDVLLEALARVHQQGPARLVIVGDGPDRSTLIRVADELGVDSQVTFAGAMPARLAFRLGTCMVLPSRAESLPYIVLEAIAARMPLIATRVGGIPEIYGEFDNMLVPADDAAALAAAMGAFIADPAPARRNAASLRQRIKPKFSIARMVHQITNFYASCGVETALPRKGQKPRKSRAVTGH